MPDSSKAASVWWKRPDCLQSDLKDAARGIGCTLGVILLSGCRTSNAGPWNPYQWDGSAFLGLYVVLIGLLFLILGWLGRKRGAPLRFDHDPIQSLDPYWIAMLSRDRLGVAQAGVAALAVREMVCFDEAPSLLGRGCLRIARYPGMTEPEQINRVERCIWDVLPPDGTPVIIIDLNLRDLPVFEEIDSELVRAGYKVGLSQSFPVVARRLGAVLAVVGIGVVRYVADLLSNRPVMALVLVILATLCVGTWLAFRGQILTEPGRILLGRIEEEVGGLAGLEPESITADWLMPALVGVHGPEVLAGTPWAKLEPALDCVMAREFETCDS